MHIRCKINTVYKTLHAVQCIFHASATAKSRRAVQFGCTRKQELGGREICHRSRRNYYCSWLANRKCLFRQHFVDHYERTTTFARSRIFHYRTDNLPPLFPCVHLITIAALARCLSSQEAGNVGRYMEKRDYVSTVHPCTHIYSFNWCAFLSLSRQKCEPVADAESRPKPPRCQSGRRRLPRWKRRLSCARCCCCRLHRRRCGGRCLCARSKLAIDSTSLKMPPYCDFLT
jgi:hypothetical protein